jgi:hypothetical protein
MGQWKFHNDLTLVHDGDGDLDIVAPGKSGLFLFEQVDFQRQRAH